MVDTEQKDMLFKADACRDSSEPSNSCRQLLVDCGATTHIVCERSHFESFDNDFDCSDHSVELADGSRPSGIVQG